MFTLDNIEIDASKKEPIYTIEIDGETYKYRGLDGIDRARLSDLQNSNEELLKFAIGACLLDGKTEKPIGEKYAYKFIRNRFDEANKIFEKLFEPFQRRAANDEAVLEEERKNFDAIPSTCTRSDFANGTESIPVTQ